MASVHLAVDLGAGSGRVVAGVSENGRLDLEEVHRFENPGTHLPGGLFWNILGLYREILSGLKKAVDRYGEISSVGIDTWAVDFGLLDREGRLLGLPHQYRDSRTEGMAERADELVGNAKLYAQTGIMPFFLNTSLQLLAEQEKGSVALKVAEDFLMIPDLLAYWLTGRKAVEKTNASTTQLFDPAAGEWAWEVIEGLSLPRKIFGEVVEPGTVLGHLRPEVEAEVQGNFPVVATASHDTAAAVAGIPGEGEYAFISSGTWSIIGVELAAPILTKEAQEAGFANEQGVEGTTRFLKNICGLWLIQECRRAWAAEGDELGYAELAELAEATTGFQAFIDPDDARFAGPDQMPEKVREFCAETKQRVPMSKGEVLRVCSDSIAFKHRVRFDQLKALSGRPLKMIAMGGGGIQNALLTQAISDACGVPLVAGPKEATACGNIVTQMVGLGQLPDMEAGRNLIRASQEQARYEPSSARRWEAELERFREICEIDQGYLK